jgi:hypothetical protein
MSDLTREEQAGGGPNRYHITEGNAFMVSTPEGVVRIGPGWLAITEAEYAQLRAAAPQSPSPAEVGGGDPDRLLKAIDKLSEFVRPPRVRSEAGIHSGTNKLLVVPSHRWKTFTDAVEKVKARSAPVPAPPADLVGELVGALRLATGYFGKPTNGWAPLRDDDQVELTVRVRIGDLKAMNAALALAAQAEARANG